MYLTLTPTATQFVNNVSNDVLTQNETKLLLWLLVGLIGIVGILIGIMWNNLIRKVSKLDDTLTASLHTHIATGKDIEALKAADDRIIESVSELDDRFEKKYEKMDSRVFSMERKLGGFMSPPGNGLQEKLG